MKFDDLSYLNKALGYCSDKNVLSSLWGGCSDDIDYVLGGGVLSGQARAVLILFCAAHPDNRAAALKALRSRAEEWRVVEGFPAYEVSNRGRVRRVGGGLRTLKPVVLHCGHTRVTLYGPNGKMRTRTVHQLVCRAFNGSPAQEDMIVCHKDGDPQNNDAGNLYWGTHQTNADDRRRHDLGRNLGAAKTPRGVARLARQGKIDYFKGMRALRMLSGEK